MSFLTDLKANTIGLVYRAWTGNVDPYTVQQQKEAADAAIAKAGTGLSLEQIQALQDQADRERAAALNANDANPNNPDGSLKAGLRIPGLGVVGSQEFLGRLEKIVYGLIAAGAVVGAFYFAQRYGSIVKKTFRKR